MKQIATFFVLSIITSLSAREVSVTGQALYMKPTNGGVDWVTAREETSGNLVRGGETHRISPDYAWGFRIGGEFVSDFCDVFVGLDGARLESDDRVTREFLVPVTVYSPLNNTTIQALVETQGVRATGKLRTRYWDIGVRGGRQFFCGCTSISPFVAFRYIDVNEHYRAALSGPNISDNPLILGIVNADRKAEFQGAGPGLGVESTWGIGCGVGLHMHTAFYALIGERKGQWDGVFFVTGLTQRPSYKLASSTIIAPAVDFSLGVNYTHRLWCADWTFEVGYSLFHAWNVLQSWLVGPVGYPALSQSFGFPLVTQDRDYGLAGPFLSLKVTY